MHVILRDVPLSLNKPVDFYGSAAVETYSRCRIDRQGFLPCYWNGNRVPNGTPASRHLAFQGRNCEENRDIAVNGMDAIGGVVG